MDKRSLFFAPLKRNGMIKRFLRSLAIYTFVIWLIAENLGGISYSDNAAILVAAGISLSLVEAFVKPLLNLLLLPFNLITLGTFRWVVNVFVLYIATLLVKGFSITAFSYPGANLGGFIVPAMDLSLFWAYIVVALAISILSSLLFWLFH